MKFQPRNSGLIFPRPGEGFAGRWEDLAAALPIFPLPTGGRRRGLTVRFVVLGVFFGMLENRGLRGDSIAELYAEGTEGEQLETTWLTLLKMMVKFVLALPMIARLGWRLAVWGFGNCSDEQIKELIHHHPLFQKNYQEIWRFVGLPDRKNRDTQ